MREYIVHFSVLLFVYLICKIGKRALVVSVVVNEER